MDIFYDVSENDIANELVDVDFDGVLYMLEISSEKPFHMHYYSMKKEVVI